MENKRYTFLDESGKILIEVLAPHHQAAMRQANATGVRVDYNTDFYSSGLQD